MRRCCVLLGVLFSALFAGAQSAERVEFSLEYPKERPEVFTISINRLGEGSYRHLPADGSEAEEQEFKLAAGAVEKIFRLAGETGNFSGDFEFKKRVAFSGRKTLSYVSAEGKRQSTSFDHSQHPAMVALNDEFRGMMETLEAEQELLRLARFDKLGLNSALARMEDRARSGWMRHLALIKPALKKLANDPSIMHLARARAGRLLEAAEKER